MKQQIYSQAFNQITQYIAGLDWSYIITFILIGYFFNTQFVRSKFIKIGKVKIRTRYRMAIVGAIYAIMIFFIRGAHIGDVERLYTSFTFSS